ncbi:MAG: 1-acyl-sn-glycerol-3-phosphate acyltransferase [Thermaurantiacus sp.]
MIALVRSMLFAALFYGVTVPIALAAALVALVSPEGTIAIARAWGRWFLWCSEVLLGIRLEVRGSIPQRDAIVAFKHSSAFETFLVLALFDRPATIMKAELLSLPVWGFVARRQGSIGVVREKGGVAMRAMLREAKAAADAGRPIIIFPEGTRVPHGTAPPLKAGLSALASGLRLPVVPVAHDAGRLWPKSFVKQPGTVTMAFQPPIAPELPREELERAVHSAINRDPCAVPEPVTREARARRVPLWTTLVPLVAFGIGWWLVWDGYRDRLVAEVSGLVPEGTRIESGGWPYRLAVRVSPVAADRQDVALVTALEASAITVHQVPWQPNRMVLNLDGPRGSARLTPLSGAFVRVRAPSAQASLRREGGRILRLSSVWERAEIESGLVAAPVRAEAFEAHLRETPANLPSGTAPRGPTQASFVLRGRDMRFAGGDPLVVIVEADVTASRPVASLAGWVEDGTVELGRVTISDHHGEVARLEATLVPDGRGGLTIAGTVETVCPASVRAALAAAAPVSELRARRPVTLPLSGTLPGGVMVPAADPGRPPPPVRGQEPPCPRLR